MKRRPPLYATYSIVARDPANGQLGVAVQTHQMTVGNFVPWLAPGAGALATQALGNIRYGPMGLALLRQGIGAGRVVDALIATDPEAERRQVAVVDAAGETAVWTGSKCIRYASHSQGEGYSVQANIMERENVVEAMAAAYESAGGDLAERMLAALHAAQAERGDLRGMQSASLCIVRGEPPQYEDPSEWRPIFDLRVDEHSDPLAELARLTRLRRATLIDEEGHNAFEAGETTQALDLWAKARALAPELGELAFWQALVLADEGGDVEGAAHILRPILLDNPKNARWIELIRRVDEAEMLDRAGCSQDLIEALGSLSV